MKDYNTRLVDVTVGEAFEILRPQLQSLIEDAVRQLPRKQEIEYGKGIPAIQELLLCSPSKANKVKASGIIDEAITQIGRSFIVNMTLARQILKEKSLL